MTTERRRTVKIKRQNKKEINVTSHCRKNEKSVKLMRKVQIERIINYTFISKIINSNS